MLIKSLLKAFGFDPKAVETKATELETLARAGAKEVIERVARIDTSLQVIQNQLNRIEMLLHYSDVRLRSLEDGTLSVGESHAVDEQFLLLKNEEERLAKYEEGIVKE